MKSSKPLSEATKQLLIKLEQMIGGNCYNTSAKNFSGRDELEDGRWIRYPLTIQLAGKPEKFSKLPHSSLFKDEDFVRARYVTGTNHFFVMRGLVEVLHHLEENHGLKLPVDPPPGPPGPWRRLLRERAKQRAEATSETPATPEQQTPTNKKP